MKHKVGETKNCVIYRVLYVPELACNLFSVRATVARGNSVKIRNLNARFEIQVEIYVVQAYQ